MLDAHPDIPVRLEVVDNGTVVAEVLAKLYRRDIEAAGIGNGRHAFGSARAATRSMSRHMRSSSDAPSIEERSSDARSGRAGAVLGLPFARICPPC